MLNLSPKIRPPSSSSNSGSSAKSKESQKGVRVIPAGQPYLTKVNGKLVMARDKKPRSSSKAAVNLLGDAFGKGEAYGPPRVARTHKRSASAAPSTISPLIIGGIPYVPQQSVIQPQPMAHPLQYQQPYPFYGVLPMLQPQAQAQQQFTYPSPHPGGPTQKDLETLRQIDGHYNLQKHSSDPALKSKAQPVTLRTTITITKHICAQCGRLRSRQYHRDNPIIPGVEPTPAFCRKCQRDASVTTCSDKSPQKPASKKGKTKKKKNQKKQDSSSNEEEKSPPIKGRKGSYVRLRPQVEVVVEEEQRASRGRRRQRDFEEEARAYGRALSPTIIQTDTAYARYEPREERRVFTEPARQRSPSPFFRYVEAPRYRENPERPARFEGKDYEPAYEIPVREKRRSDSRSFDNHNQPRNMSRTRYADEWNPRNEDGFEDSQNLYRSHESSHRPRERAAEWTYEYQPKSQREAERGRGKSDRSAFDPPSGTRTFPAREEAESYYNNDWDVPEPEPERRRRSTRTGYRRDRYEDSELGASEVTYDPYNMPRVPTPPRTHEEQPPYPTSKRDRKGKAPQRFPSPEKFQPHGRNRSKATERSLVPSPVRRSGNDGRGHGRKVSWDEPEHHGWEDIYGITPGVFYEVDNSGADGADPADDDLREFPRFPMDFGPGDPSMWGVPRRDANGEYIDD